MTPTVPSGPGLVVTAPPTRFFGYYPGTVVVVTAEHGGRRNAMSAGWHAALSADPPLYGVAVAPGRFTYRLIRESGAFVVHLLPFEHARVVAGLGSTTASDGVDKLTRFGLRTVPGPVTGAPVVQEAIVAYECTLDAVHVTGDHDLMVGRVAALHHRPEAFDDALVQDGEAVPGAVYYGRGTYEELGTGTRARFAPELFREEPRGA